jgi:hypothetical protein
LTLIVLIGLFVQSCAGTPQTRATSGLAIACDTYASILDQITPRKASLSVDMVKRIDAANRIVAPACKSDSVIDPAQAVTIVQNGIGLLTVIEGAL